MNKREIAAVQECVRELREIKATNGDPEGAHSMADRALIDLFKAIGLREVAEAWEAITPKWYA